MSVNINNKMNNFWNCIYCDRQFPKEGNWETHQKTTFTEGQMKSLGRTYMDMNDTSTVKETQWFQHLMKIPNTNMLTCKKRRCIECYLDGDPIKFSTRSGWQKHQSRHHGNEPYEPKYKEKKMRKTKLQLTVDKQVKNYLCQIEQSLKEGKKISNINVNITWDEVSPEPKVLKQLNKEDREKANKKNDYSNTLEQLSKQLEEEGLAPLNL
tara:strand:- start:3751 stop:4380 length:630 start_codon:yes stop_codon:yes gene_type:complete